MDTVATDPLALHLRLLEAALDGGPRRPRRELLREVGDHLDDAAEAYRRAGYDPAEAARLAVADFGTVAEVAPGLRATLAVSASRRTAWMVLSTLALQPFLWDGGVDLAGAAHAHAHAPDGVVYRLLDTGIELLGMLLIVGAVLAVLAAGIGQRWVGAHPRRQRIVVRATAWLTLAAAALLPGTGIAMLSLTGEATAPLWAMLGLLMVAPMSAAALSARRCLAVTA